MLLREQEMEIQTRAQQIIETYIYQGKPKNTGVIDNIS